METPQIQPLSLDMSIGLEHRAKGTSCRWRKFGQALDAGSSQSEAA